MALHDLLYMENNVDYEEIKGTILKKFPDISFEDGSDWLHPCRLIVKHAELDRAVWFAWLLTQGAADVSLNWQVTMRCEQRFAKALVRWLLAEKKRVQEADNGAA